jgi:hypothetical protein
MNGYATLAMGMFLLSGCGDVAMSKLDARDYFSDPQAVALGQAACEGKVEKVAALIADGVPVNAPGHRPTNAAGHRDFTPLAFAVACQSEAGVRALLEAGADPNYRHENDFTTVWVAAGWGNTAILRLLLDHGGDVNAADNSGETVLMRALALGIETRDRDAWANYYLLLDRGADINQASGIGETVAGFAAALGRFDKIAEFLDRGYSYDLLSVAWAAEHIAVSEDRQPDIARVKVLLQERDVQWPIPHPLSDANRIEYMQSHPDYAAKHPESWPEKWDRGKAPVQAGKEQ